jgi:hypothetical protein
MSAETLKWGLCGVAVGVLFPYRNYLPLLTLPSSKQSSLSMTMHPQSTVLFESGRYIQVKVESGELAALKY